MDSAPQGAPKSELYSRAVESSLAGMYAIQRDRLVWVNGRTASIFGYTLEEMVGNLSPLDLVAPEDRPTVAERIRRRMSGEVPEAHYSFHGVRKDGHQIFVEVAGTVVEIDGERTIVGTLLDMTERRRLEDQVRQIQKMEAIGRLAGGVAHDFNNLLAVIGGYTELLLGQEVAEGPNRDSLLEIEKAAHRAATLTRQLLAFSRQQVLQPRVIDLNVALADAVPLVRRLTGEQIEILLELSRDLGSVKIDPSQLEHVILQIAVNARDAMPDGGVLTFATSRIVLGDSGHGIQLAAGPYVQLSIRDTGVGMDEETRGRVFEPFFTTKQRGKGTGLGLSTVYGIVKQSGGYIWVASQPGRGTEITIQLPHVAERPTRESSGKIQRIQPATETILLVEDEDAVRVLGRDLLERTGYTVLEAHSAEEALELSQTHQGDIHLLLTDVVMSGISGLDLAARMKTSRPATKILFMSGYTSDAVPHGMLDADKAFLQKPFTRQTLSDKVREVLDSSQV